ncbi:MAG: (deoxy)nucleoside triphosphate pyrophosphohydrolase [Desulfobacteraceae bacterium]|nr:(deoxy)nucleoside triphosphate pyrophosphohydrolase [Desulfobacteraceae bacterium]
MATYPLKMEPAYRSVVAAVIRRHGRYLVCRRPVHKRHGGLWEFPGGKLQSGESLADAVRRELAEELAVEVASVGGVCYRHTDPENRFVIWFIETEIAGAPLPEEHEEIRWCPPSELPLLSFPPADEAFVRRIVTAGSTAAHSIR